MIVHSMLEPMSTTPCGNPPHPDLIVETTMELYGSASTVSADAESQAVQRKSNSIRNRIKQRSSRILSLLGLRGPSGGRAVDYGDIDTRRAN